MDDKISWRAKAAKVRGLAESLGDQLAVEMLLELAAEYDAREAGATPASNSGVAARPRPHGVIPKD